VTHTLSEAEYHGCRPHPRRSVRRASGFVLTRNPEVMVTAILPVDDANGDLLKVGGSDGTRLRGLLRDRQAF